MGKQRHLQSIIDAYLAKNATMTSDRVSQALSDAIHWIDGHVASDVVNLIEIAAANESEAKNLVFAFFDKAIDFKQQPAVFHANDAPALKQALFNQSSLYTNALHLYQPLNQLGIQEKYIRGLLHKEHWLTDLDIQRAIKRYDSTPPIRVSPFDEHGLRTTLDAVLKEQAQANASYLVPLVLNRGGLKEGQGDHWLSATISIDPIGRTISYHLQDSLLLSEEDKAHYHAIMKAAVSGKEGTFRQPFPPNEGWVLSEETSSIQGGIAAIDEFASGYFALHHLLRDPRVCNKQQAAVEYAELPLDTSRLLTAFFKDELSELSINDDVYGLLSQTSQALFAESFVPHARVKILDLAQLSVFLTEGRQPDAPYATHQKVEEVIGSFQPSLRLIRFPEGAYDLTLTAVEYNDFFHQLSAIEGLEASQLSRVDLPFVNANALDGMVTFFSTQSSTSLKEISLTLLKSIEAHKESYVNKLLLALQVLAQAGIESIVLNDEALLEQDDVQKIKNLILVSGIACRLSLPIAYQHTAIQRDIDSLVEQNQQKRNKQQMTAGMSLEKKGAIVRETPIRRRQKLNAEHVKQRDVELQDSVEAEVELESPLALPQALADFTVNTVFRLDTLGDAVNNDHFAPFTVLNRIVKKTELIKLWHQLFGNIVQGDLQIGQKGFKTIGNQRVFDCLPYLSGVSDTALAQLLTHNPAGGIDFHHLPVGFVLISDEENKEGRVLHYEPGYTLGHKIAPLFVTSKQAIPLTIELSHDIIALDTTDALLKTCWSALNEDAIYQRDKHEKFRRLLPDLLALPPSELSCLMDLCGGARNLQVDKMAAFFEHKNALASPEDSSFIDIKMVDAALKLREEEGEKREAFIALARAQEKTLPEHTLLTMISAASLKQDLKRAIDTYGLKTPELNELLRIYSLYGEAGITKILNTWYAIDNLEHLDLKTLPSITHHTSSYKDMVSGNELLTACQNVNDFTIQKREWFFKLYQQHSPKENTSFINLVASFTAFSQSIETDKKLPFYSLSSLPKPFTVNIDMATAMGRILSILEACREEDLAAQWQVMAAIDLSSAGAVRALQDGQKGRYCRFVLPAMNVNPTSPELDRTAYDTVLLVNDIAPKRQQGDEIIFNEDSAELIQQRFFRYLAYQEDKMPLPFYQKAIEQIEAFSGKVERTELNTLYRLLAEMTTGKNYHYFIRDEQEAAKNWEHILRTIDAAQLETGFKYKAMCLAAGEDVNKAICKGIISHLGSLETVPSIDVMDRLIGIMTASIMRFKEGDLSIKQFQASMTKLALSNEQLRKLTTIYGDKTYMGMTFYQDEHYQKTYDVPALHQETFGKEVSLFDHHILLELSIHHIQNNEFEHFAVPLISTFSLDHQDIPNLSLLYAKAKSPIASYLMTYIGELLLDIKDNSQLDAQVLASFLNDLVTEDGLIARIEHSIQAIFAQIDELLQKIEANEETPLERMQYAELTLLKTYLDHGMPFQSSQKAIVVGLAKESIVSFLSSHPLLSNAFDRDYWIKLKANEASGNVQLLIDRHFKTPSQKEGVETIRVRFSHLPEEELIGLINEIAIIINHSDSHSEKIEILNALAKVADFASSEQYSILLAAIKKVGSSPFVYFMQQTTLYKMRHGVDVEDICNKAIFFIRDALPHLTNRFHHLNMIEFSPLIAAVVNAGLANELTQTITIDDSFNEWRQVLTALQDNKTNPDELEQIILGMSLTQKAAIPPLESLMSHLALLKNPMIKSIEVGVHEEEVSELGEDEVNEQQAVRYEEREVEIEKSPTLLQKVWHWGRGFWTDNKPATEKIRVKKYYKISTQYQEVRDPAHLDADLVGNMIKDVAIQEQQSISYAYALRQSLGLVDQLIDTYPSAKSLIMPLARHYLEHKSQDTNADLPHITTAYTTLNTLHNELVALNDKDMVISLCQHFSGEGDFHCSNLIRILQGRESTQNESIDFSGYKTLDLEQKKQFFTVVTALLNNEKECHLADMAHLIHAIQEPLYLAMIKEIYARAPYPSLDKMNRWWLMAKEAEDPLLVIHQYYNEWSTKPVLREDGSQTGEEAINGFNLPYAKEQAAKITGMTYSHAELDEIKARVEEVKTLTTNAILKRVQQIRENPELAEQHKANPTELMALMAELLYRTKGLPAQYDDKGNRSWGKSFEINTSQYLGVYSQLKSDKPTIVGMGTGEGKSRTMAITIACQWALGLTVDFVTADVSLATRDYLEYQAYFKSFGAQTNLITAQTPVEQYRLNGINFSDASNLSLFRNKARSQGLGDAVIHPDRKKRCLLLDEADKTLFDTIDTRFNYSAQADESIQDIPWIYEALIEFFSIPEHEALFHGDTSNADECNRKLKIFIRERLTLDKDIRKLEGISRNQLEAWQASAISALNLKYGDDFTLEGNVPIVTKKGPGIVNMARLIADGSASKNAKFSFGVHQCLHARLNLEKIKIATGGIDTTNPLHLELSKPNYQDRRFPVDSENQIIYSATSKALIDDYDVLRGVTGTPGAWIERAEKANIAFIDIPRHRGLKRFDRPFRLTRNERSQFAYILDDIRIAMSNNQPSLIICKNDNESKRLQDYLEKHLSTEEKSKLYRINADTSIQEAALHVEEKAGQAGAITIATARLGRGTDIPLHGAAKKAGLHVIGTYLPRERDYIQIVGRAGRFGAEGSSRLILNAAEMRQQFIKTGSLPEDFYTATESYLEHLQKAMDVSVQKQRIIKDAVSDFRMSLTINFFDDFFKEAIKNTDKKGQDKILDSWRKFFDASDKQWNERWPQISDSLANDNMANVEELLQDYQAEIQGHWQGLHSRLHAEFGNNETVSFDALQDDIAPIKLTKRGIELLHYDINAKVAHKTAIVDNRDDAYRNRAVIYKGFWKNLWYNVLPSLFSWNDTVYTVARKNGNMSWSQYLFGGKMGTPLASEHASFVSLLSEKEAMEQLDIAPKGSSTRLMQNKGFIAQNKNEKLPPKKPTVPPQKHTQQEIKAEICNGRLAANSTLPPLDDEHASKMK